jgi:hypothetical protein
MRLKDNTVSLANLSPQIVLALIIAESVYQQWRAEIVITSANDAKHSETSLHYAGNAVDIRIATLLPNEREPIRDQIKAALNNDFDVILESDHIHIEYQPRRRNA